jgi:hypothetical protein
MNYTYLPSSPYTPFPSIIMTTNPSSRKTHNLQSNSKVSLLVHDWVSHRPHAASTSQSTPGNKSNVGDWGGASAARESSLVELLKNLNSSELSSISATINGTARLVEPHTDEERYLRARHLANNTFGASVSLPPADVDGNGGSFARAEEEKKAGIKKEGGNCFIEGEKVRVVVVRLRDGRVSDWQGGVRDWKLKGDERAW